MPSHYWNKGTEGYRRSKRSTSPNNVLINGFIIDREPLEFDQEDLSNASDSLSLQGSESLENVVRRADENVQKFIYATPPYERKTDKVSYRKSELQLKELSVFLSKIDKESRKKIVDTLISVLNNMAKKNENRISSQPTRQAKKYSVQTKCDKINSIYKMSNPIRWPSHKKNHRPDVEKLYSRESSIQQNQVVMKELPKARKKLVRLVDKFSAEVVKKLVNKGEQVCIRPTTITPTDGIKKIWPSKSNVQIPYQRSFCFQELGCKKSTSETQIHKFKNKKQNAWELKQNDLINYLDEDLRRGDSEFDISEVLYKRKSNKIYDSASSQIIPANQVNRKPRLVSANKGLFKKFLKSSDMKISEEEYLRWLKTKKLFDPVRIPRQISSARDLKLVVSRVMSLYTSTESIHHSYCINESASSVKTSSSFADRLPRIMYEHVVLGEALNLFCQLSSKKPKELGVLDRLFQIMLFLVFYKIFVYFKQVVSYTPDIKNWGMTY